MDDEQNMRRTARHVAAQETPRHEDRPVADLGEQAQCPLHFAMQQLAQAAVSQLVYYAHGEYTPRPELLRSLDRWQRLHNLIAERICLVSRTGHANDDDLRAALTLIPEGQFTGQREMLARCAACHHGDACPLERRPELSLFGGEETRLEWKQNGSARS